MSQTFMEPVLSAGRWKKAMNKMAKIPDFKALTFYWDGLGRRENNQ